MSLKNPITGVKHRKWSCLHKSMATELKSKKVVPGNYDEIVWFGKCPGHAIVSMYSDILEEEYIELDSKGRGSCLNHDLYAYDPKQGVAVIQARQYYKRAAKHYGATRKTYFLVGRNEITKEFFRHPVGSHAVRAACRKSEHPTRADVVRVRTFR